MLVPGCVVVNRERSAIQLPDLRADAIEHVAVVRDEDAGARIGDEQVLEPTHHADVEMVRRFVEQQHVGLLEQDARERGARPLSAGERARRPVEVRFVEPEHGEHRAHLPLQALAAVPVERLARVAVRAHQRGLAVGVAGVGGRAQLALERAQPRFVGVDARERAGQHVAQGRGVVAHRVLREVAEPRAARANDLAGVRRVDARRGCAAATTCPAPLPPTSPTFSRSRSTPPSPSNTVRAP